MRLTISDIFPVSANPSEKLDVIFLLRDLAPLPPFPSPLLFFESSPRANTPYVLAFPIESCHSFTRTLDTIWEPLSRTTHHRVLLEVTIQSSIFLFSQPVTRNSPDNWHSASTNQRLVTLAPRHRVRKNDILVSTRAYSFSLFRYSVLHTLV